MLGQRQDPAVSMVRRLRILSAAPEVFDEVGELSLCGQPEHVVDDTLLYEAIPLGHPLDLAFAEHVHGFITLDSPLRRGKCSTPQPWIHAAFHKPMILF
jgi:hypothetical protein